MTNAVSLSERLQVVLMEKPFSLEEARLVEGALKELRALEDLAAAVFTWSRTADSRTSSGNRDRVCDAVERLERVRRGAR